MRVSLIAALANNRVIGRDNALPWRLGTDLRRFKSLTLGKPVIMGRKTHESIGRPLPKRDNIVLTRDRDYRAPGCRVVHSVDEALSAAGGHEEVMVIGGERVYAAMLERADRLYLTWVDAEVSGDARFPGFDPQDWHESRRETHPADADNDYDSDFVVLDRIAR